MKRRRFMALSGAGIGVAVQQPLVQAAAPLYIRAWQPDGKPLPAQRLQQLYFLDRQEEPWINPPRQVRDGELLSQSPPQWPVAVALQLPVAGFGDVWLYADNQGQGFRPGDFPLLLNRELARDRLYRVRQAVQDWQQQGFQFPVAIAARLLRAEAAIKQAELVAMPQRIALWNQALMEGLWAGEEAAVCRARQRIRRQPPRPMQFGANFFGYPQFGAAYQSRFQEAFELATVPFYWRNLEPQPGQLQLDRIDRSIVWLSQAGIAAKAHPLVWFHEVGVPNWLRNFSYGQLLEAIGAHVEQMTRRYGDVLASVDVINEAHGVPWANELHLTSDQFLELTALACAAARRGHPSIRRIINNCCLWGRAAAYIGPPNRSPYRYLQDCLQADIDFEVIGLQLYYPDHDLFEIDRCLDRFIRLGKPLQITEMATSSQAGTDENSQLQVSRGLWRSPWTPTLQADWVEFIYTLAYSKPEIEAVGWWDLADAGTFWPFGGLLDESFQPKPAFLRLLELKNQWGLR